MLHLHERVYLEVAMDVLTIEQLREAVQILEAQASLTRSLEEALRLADRIEAEAKVPSELYDLPIASPWARLSLYWRGEATKQTSYQTLEPLLPYGVFKKPACVVQALC